MSYKPVKKGDQNKAWNRREERSKRYQPGRQAPERKFLIICEGENTEPDYFKDFTSNKKHVESYGIGSSKTALIEHIIEVKAGYSADTEVWAVFDMDAKADQLSQQKEDFNRAIAVAKRHGIKVAWSNDAFELWLVLHFQGMSGAQDRQRYYQILSEKFDCDYEKEGKKKAFTLKLADELRTRSDASLPDALRRAKRLHEAHIAEGLAPADQNPCTTVYALVCALLEGETDCPAVCVEEQENKSLIYRLL